MKKQILLLALATAALLSCKSSKKYPALIDEGPMHYTQQDQERKPLLTDYLAYKDATTKNSSVLLPIKQRDTKYPWDTKNTEGVAEDLVEQMTKTFKAHKDDASEVNKEPSGTILLVAAIPLDPKDEIEQSKTGLIQNKHTVLDDVKGKVISYDLRNEKNEKVTITNDFLGTTQGGLQEVDGKLCQSFGFQTMGLNTSYTTLKGFIEVGIEIPVKVDHEEIDASDVGDVVKINNQKVRILELDQNTLHIVVEGGGSPDFSIYFDNCNNSVSGGVGIPEKVYETFRANQGLSYEDFEKKYQALGLDKAKDIKDGNTVWIYKSDSCKIEKVFFYAPDMAKTVKKTVKIPVDIK